MRASDFGAPTALMATLGLAATCWVVAVRQMDGMDLGVATELGSLAFFVAAWVPMMAAMMLPGAAPAVVRRARSHRPVLAVPLFLVSYLAVWTLVGLAVYVLDRPHGSAVAGALTIAAGVYELTPVKRECRRRCRDSRGSGLQFGLFCVGSSIGLTAMLVGVGVMSVTWMAIVGVVIVAAVDVPLALAVVGLGALIVVAPDAVPGLMPPM
jgi:predicted metal-binding membrane protein